MTNAMSSGHTRHPQPVAFPLRPGTHPHGLIPPLNRLSNNAMLAVPLAGQRVEHADCREPCRFVRRVNPSLLASPSPFQVSMEDGIVTEHTQLFPCILPATVPGVHPPINAALSTVIMGHLATPPNGNRYR